MDQYTSLSALSKSLRVSRHRLGALLIEAGIPVVKLSPRRTRVRIADVSEWLEECRMS